MADSLAGAKFYISTTAQNTDLADAAAYALLSYTQVSNVGSVGQMGTETNILTYDTLDTDVTQKAKGISNAGDPEIEVAQDYTDAGQDAMRAACLTKDSYAFKYELANGTVFYNRGVVGGPTQPNGRNEDFVLEIYKLGLVQLQVKA